MLGADLPVDIRRHVDDDRAFLDRGKHVPRHDPRRPSARHEDRAHDEIRVEHDLLDAREHHGSVVIAKVVDHLVAADEYGSARIAVELDAVGVVALDADTAERWARDDARAVIMVRPETKPDDVHGMLAAKGILTSSGGRTSHAALVARQFGKPAVVGASDLGIDLQERTMIVKDRVVHEGEWVSVDGTSGEVFLGKLETRVPDIDDPWLTKLLGWADEARVLDVWANADYPADAARAVHLGANGIGLCRTEHMFFDQERLPIVQKMITATFPAERADALAAAVRGGTAAGWAALRGCVDAHEAGDGPGDHRG